MYYTINQKKNMLHGIVEHSLYLVDESVHQTPSQAKPPHSQSPHGVLLHIYPSFLASQFILMCTLSVRHDL